jgi:carboxypeptidase Q
VCHIWLYFLGLRPKRTIRTVLWTAEEEGLLGSAYYHKNHPGKGNDTEKFVFVSESDEGAFRPRSWNAHLPMFGSKRQQSAFNTILLYLNLNGVPILPNFKNGGS